MDAEEGLLYCYAHSLAEQILEADGYSCQSGRYRASPAAGGDFEAILSHSHVGRDLGSGRSLIGLREGLALGLGQGRSGGDRGTQRILGLVGHLEEPLVQFRHQFFL